MPRKREYVERGPILTVVTQGKPGIWPGGEPQSVRDAYDRMLADQAKQNEAK